MQISIFLKWSCRVSVPPVLLSRISFIPFLSSFYSSTSLLSWICPWFLCAALLSVSSWVPLSVPLCPPWFVCSPSAQQPLLLLKLIRPWLLQQGDIWVSVCCVGGFFGFPAEDFHPSFQMNLNKLCFSGCCCVPICHVVIKSQREHMRDYKVSANWLLKLPLSGSLNSLLNSD